VNAGFVGWVEHFAKPIIFAIGIDGYRFAPPILRNQRFRAQHRFDLAQNSRRPFRPLHLPGLIGDQILADFDPAVDNAAGLAMNGDRVAS
jgi:hypothetical protein